jgi:hypothetical protein
MWEGTRHLLESASGVLWVQIVGDKAATPRITGSLRSTSATTRGLVMAWIRMIEGHEAEDELQSLYADLVEP